MDFDIQKEFVYCKERKELISIPSLAATTAKEMYFRFFAEC